MEDKMRSNYSNQEYLPLILESVPEVFRLKAEKELNETEENVKKGLTILRDCIEKNQLRLSSDANFLLPYLRQAKFDFKRAGGKIIHSAKIFKNWQDEIISLDLKRIQAVIDNKFVGLLPVRDKEGRTVIFARGSGWNKGVFDIKDAAVVFISLLLFTSTYPLTSICGLTYIADADVGDKAYVTDSLIMLNGYRKYLHHLFGHPFRVQRTDVLNTNNLVRWFFNGIRPLLPSQIRDRVFMHGSDFEDFHKIYHPSMLPSEFGGTSGPINSDSYRDKFMEFMRNFQEQAKHNKINYS